MSVIGERVKEACKRKGVAMAVACDQAGVNYKTLHAQISNDRAIPFETVDRLAQYFDVPMNYFSAFRPTVAVRSEEQNSILQQRAAAAYTAALRSEQIEMMREGYEIGTDEVLNWLGSQGGILENFDALRERVDLFHPTTPTDRMMKPHRIGQNSLARRFFRLEDEDHYVKTVGGFERETIDEILLAHLQAKQLKYSITDIDIDVQIGSDRIVESYRRIIAPVKDRSGRVYNLVHAKLI